MKWMISFIFLYSLSSYASDHCAQEFKSRNSILQELVDLKIELESLSARSNAGDNMARSMSLVLSNEFKLKLKEAIAAFVFTESEFRQALDHARVQSGHTRARTTLEEDTQRSALIRLLIHHSHVSPIRKVNSFDPQKSAISDDGSFLIMELYNPVGFLLVDSATGVPTRPVAFPEEIKSVSSFTPLTNKNRVLVRRLSSPIYEIDVSNGEVIHRYLENYESATSNDSLPALNGTFINILSNGQITLWDMNSQKKIQTFWDPSAISSEIKSAALSSDGQWTAAAGFSGPGSSLEANAISLWTPSRPEPIHRFLGHKAMILNIAIYSSTQTMQSIDRDGVAITWDLKAQKEVSRFNLPPMPFAVAAFSPDGKILARANKDVRMDDNKFLTIYSAESGLELQNVELSGRPDKIMFSRDSLTIFSLSRHDTSDIFRRDPP